MSTRLVLEFPQSLAKCRRLDAAEALLDWLMRSSAVPGLPDAEIVVEATAGRRLPAALVNGRHDAVGSFLVRTGGSYPDDFRVAAALGADPGEDADDWRGRLETIPHELGHVAQFAAFSGGRPPGIVARAAAAAARPGQPAAFAVEAALASWTGFDHEAGGPASPEMTGRRAITGFLAAYPAFAAPPAGCPAGCAHRPR